jgi:hypothetical protein
MPLVVGGPLKHNYTFLSLCDPLWDFALLAKTRVLFLCTSVPLLLGALSNKACQGITKVRLCKDSQQQSAAIGELVCDRQ